jgi:hypothetical protein
MSRVVALLTLILIQSVFANPNLVEPPSQGFKSADHQDEAREVLRFLESNYLFPVKNRDGRVAVYCSGGATSTHITVYGVLDFKEQDRVIALLQAELPKQTWKQIYILFRDKEIFVMKDTGWQQRENENDLRSAIIKK